MQQDEAGPLGAVQAGAVVLMLLQRQRQHLLLEECLMMSVQPQQMIQCHLK